MLNNHLRLQFIEAYLRDGETSANYQTIKRALYDDGANKLDIIEFIVTAQIYGTLENFYHKNPAMQH